MVQRRMPHGVKVGDTIRITRMADQNGKDWQATRYNGREGVVELIDGIGQLHGTWGGLAVIPGEDEFIVIKRAESLRLRLSF
ncbi:MAG: DUF4314 domain-containing protein [Bacteroidales bacterium]|nr:DUF4314 domain-containing protein [Bacteroidales bacterium]